MLQTHIIYPLLVATALFIVSLAPEARAQVVELPKIEETTDATEVQTPPEPAVKIETQQTVKFTWGCSHTTPCPHHQCVKPGETPPVVEVQQQAPSRPRDWRLQLLPPKFSFLAGLNHHLLTIGLEGGLGFEINESHVISLVGEKASTGDGEFWGAGAGYAYKLNFAQDLVSLELGGTVGYHPFEVIAAEADAQRRMESGIIILMLRPTLHLGYKVAFLSIEPKIGFGTGIVAGASAGLTIRL